MSTLWSENNYQNSSQSTLQAIHEGKRYQCQFCNHTSTQQGDLKRHIKAKHEGDRIQCTLCDFKARYRQNLKKHILSIHQGEQSQSQSYEFKQCTESCDGFQHTEPVPKGKPIYACPYCDYKATFICLNRHIKLIHDDKTYQCKICDYKVAKKCLLKRHTKDGHPDYMKLLKFWKS